MAFVQFKLDIATEQSRGIFNIYVYDNKDDAISDIQTLNYFSDSRFAISDPDNWFEGFMIAEGSDGILFGFIDEAGTLVPANITNPPGQGAVIEFNSDINTGSSDLAGIYNLTSNSGDTTLIISNSDIALASPDSTWTLAVIDTSGTLTANGRKLSIKNEDISILSVASGSNFTASANHNLSSGDTVVHTTFPDATYNGTFAVSSIISPTVYEVSAIVFNATGTGNAVKTIEGLASVDITSDFGSLSFLSDGSNVFLSSLSGNANNSTQPVSTGDPSIIHIYSTAQMPLTLAADGNMRWHPVAGKLYITHGVIIIPLIALPSGEVSNVSPAAVTIIASNQTNALLFNGSSVPHIWGRGVGTFTIRATQLVDISNTGFGGGTVLFDLVGFSPGSTLILDNVAPIFFKSVGNLVNMLLDVNSSTCVSCLSGLVMRDTIPLGISTIGFISLNPFAVTVTAPTLCFMGDFSTVSSSTGNFEQTSSGAAFCIDSAVTGIFNIIGNSYDGDGDFFAGPISNSISAFDNVDVVITGFSDSAVNPGVDTTVEFGAITDVIIGQEILIADEAAYNGLHTIVRVAGDQMSFDINVLFDTGDPATLKRTQVTSSDHFMVRDQTNTISGTTNYNGTQQILKLVDDDNFIIPVAFVADDATGTVSSTSKDSKDIGVDSALNGAAKNSRTIGFGELNGNSAITTVTASTYSAIDVTGMVENSVSERFTLINAVIGLFRYDGSKPITSEIQAVLTAVKVGSTEQYRFSVSVNGAIPVFASAVYAPMEVKTTEVDTTVLVPLSLVNGDTVQVMVAGDGTSDGLTITDAVIRVGGA